MSAYILDQEDINKLVNAAIWLRLNVFVKPNSGGSARWVDVVDHAQEVGQLLWRENHRSVNHRYSERTRTPKFEYSMISNPLLGADKFPALAELVRLLERYEYQTCEHPGWRSSAAFDIWLRLGRKVLSTYAAWTSCTKNGTYGKAALWSA